MKNIEIWNKVIEEVNTFDYPYIKYYTFNQFDFIVPDSEERIIIFVSHKQDYVNLSLMKFAVESLYVEYLLDRPYMAPEYTWQKRKKLYNPQNMRTEDFYKTFVNYSSGLKKQLPIKVEKEEIIKAYILFEEWNEIFIIAETKESFYGFSWETTA
ncbi:hypothetical protein [Clostridium saccharobutylicum]|uniref:Uncharacterized protein n=1 Tax=Clostridium saccharobutylicum DSM 13864 TaxID=1345695 RepID=U5MT51_CLOSA|nr:hypothetical protein [Clostridium saccharobutylicum]AGX42627.1 hypothetical protein CLSA_c16290 [Clostridium saccharobutylicum DSM 13864]AQR89915.1 hypothetical protein CLOSC_16220 [Clostridium saccharobutylicum]AQR99820.1 hypothetical protein CSACC_16290 [Clostridium saccharobutylicum]AQS09548.1 hypothetical protein CLOBY_16770 [Clostridium saccharobutylicum]AQS13804.1 hypothetical protein CLOSACC_16290 [Clostridium saccharobutylicum]